MERENVPSSPKAKGTVLIIVSLLYSSRGETGEIETRPSRKGRHPDGRSCREVDQEDDVGQTQRRAQRQRQRQRQCQ